MSPVSGAHDERGIAVRLPGFWQSMALLAGIRVALLVCGLGRTLRVLRWLDRRCEHHVQRDQIVARTIEETVARAAALFPGRALCLEQSLALYTLLRRSAVPARLRLGIQAYPFAAHAWVDVDGVPLNDIAEHVAFYTALEDVLP